MEIEYEEHDYKGNPHTELTSLENAVVDNLLYKTSHGIFHLSRDKVHLEEQPKAICRAFGRLLNILAEKGIINIDNFNDIVDAEDSFRRTAKFKNESSGF